MTFTKQNVHPLEAVPVRSPSISEQPQSGGGLLLRLRLQPEGRIASALARIFGPQELRLALDHAGTEFWRQIDDRRSLREICRRLSPNGDREMEAAVIRYSADLVRRGFLHLAIPVVPTP